MAVFFQKSSQAAISLRPLYSALDTVAELVETSQKYWASHSPGEDFALLMHGLINDAATTTKRDQTDKTGSLGAQLGTSLTAWSIAGSFVVFPFHYAHQVMRGLHKGDLSPIVLVPLDGFGKSVDFIFDRASEWSTGSLSKMNSFEIAAELMAVGGTAALVVYGTKNLTKNGMDGISGLKAVVTSAVKNTGDDGLVLAAATESHQGAMAVSVPAELTFPGQASKQPFYMMAAAATDSSGQTGEAMWKTSERSPRQTKILDDIEATVRTTERPVVVVDIDDTILAARERELRIWREYGREHGIESLVRMAFSALSSWDMQVVMVDTLGMSAEWFASTEASLRAFWSERFFSNEYAAADVAIPGSPEYISALHDAGAHIVYLSGRNAEEMGVGTMAALRRNGFPVEGERVTAILKPKPNKELWASGLTEQQKIEMTRKADAEFKSNALAQIRSRGNVVATFDNEPGNVNANLTNFGGTAVRVATSQAKNTTLVDGVLEIFGFLR